MCSGASVVLFLKPSITRLKSSCHLIRLLAAWTELKRDFPQVIFYDMGCVKAAGAFDSNGTAHDLYDRRTAAGLKIARGEIMAFLEDYGVPDPDWCEQIIRAHQLPHGVIGGAVEHSGKGSLNWAVYFLDFGRYQLPLREGPANYLTDVNVSYKRDALQSVKDLWRVNYNEVTVNWALAKKRDRAVAKTRDRSAGGPR